MWDAAQRLGFAGGRVLEPGAGAGTHDRHRPAGLAVEMVGVELDPTTAAIAAALYPHAQIRNESFADTRLPDGFFDLAIGNVPFADVTLHDPRHNRGGHSLHNHFLIKSLHLTRPGGLVVALTSRFTLDARNPAARREMAELADLVGALRLPEGAFRAVAGTDVVDRPADPAPPPRRRSPPGGRRGSAASRWPPPTAPLAVNEVFAAHPDWVLGELSTRHGQYNDRDLTVRPGPATAGPAPRGGAGRDQRRRPGRPVDLDGPPAGEVVPIRQAPAATVERPSQGGQPAGDRHRAVRPGRERRGGALPADPEIGGGRAAGGHRGPRRHARGPRRPGGQLGRRRVGAGPAATQRRLRQLRCGGTGR